MALLKNNTRIFGRANVDNLLTVGSIFVTNTVVATSNTTGTIILTGPAGIATRGNIYSGNIVITGAVNSNGITFPNGTRQTTSALEKANTQAQIVEGNIIANTGFIVRGAITDDQGNNTVTFGTSSPVLIQNTTPSTNNTTGALVVRGGVGISGNVSIGNTSFINSNRALTNYGTTHNVLGLGSGNRTIDLTLGNYFSANCNGTTTWTFSNTLPSPIACGFILELTNGGSATQNWPSVKWPGGTAPSLTASGVDVLTFITDDGGTIWRGVVSMLDSK